MIDQDTRVEVPAGFDSFRRDLVAAFRESRDGEGTVELARKMMYEFFRDRGKSGIITFKGQLTPEDKVPLNNLQGSIRGEILGLAQAGKPIKRESFEYLREHFEEGRAVVYCIMGAYVEAHQL